MRIYVSDYDDVHDAVLALNGGDTLVFDNDAPIVLVHPISIKENNIIVEGAHFHYSGLRIRPGTGKRLSFGEEVLSQFIEQLNKGS